MLPALNEISIKQSQPTQDIMKNSKQIMGYVAKYPNAYILFHYIYMILMLDTYAAYFVMLKAQIFIVLCYYLENKTNAKPHSELNGTILI